MKTKSFGNHDGFRPSRRSWSDRAKVAVGFSPRGEPMTLMCRIATLEFSKASSGYSSYKILALIALILTCTVGAILMMGGRHQPKSGAITVNETPRRDLIQKEGRWYRQGQGDAFTGIMVDNYPDGVRLSRCVISNGVLNGLSECWYTNGQMQVREYYKDGVSNGRRQKWHENGNLLSQASIVEGKVTGTFRSWHDNGQLSEQIEMKLGKADGVALAYYPSGFMKAETTVQDGQILNRTSWKDGERAATKLQ